MSWFHKLCRDSGLMIHHIIHPDPNKQELSRKVEEKRVNEKVTLRRTTVEEIEIHEGSKKTTSTDN